MASALGGGGPTVSSVEGGSGFLLSLDCSHSRATPEVQQSLGCVSVGVTCLWQQLLVLTNEISWQLHCHLWPQQGQPLLSGPTYIPATRERPEEGAY